MNIPQKYALLLVCIVVSGSLYAQQAAPAPKTALLLGRWEVLSYSEQGVPVDKKQAPHPQALAVYEHIRKQRALTWYGYTDYEDLSRREYRAFERWVETDSLNEVERVAKAIELPYYAVFFPDSTLSMYNKDGSTKLVSFPEVRHFVFSAATMSLDIIPGLANMYGPKSEVQILLLTETRLTLYIPEEAEIVELVKTTFTIP